MESSIMGAKGSDEASDLGSEVGSLVFFWLGFRVLRWDPQREAQMDFLLVEESPPCRWNTLGKLVAVSRLTCRLSCFPQWRCP